MQFKVERKGGNMIASMDWAKDNYYLQKLFITSI